ncbi:hypothetical protein R9X47_09345 [Wukongibacter baidiensis]|uniref:hypothetical protein n=1 Tax=Wukongibacter baidiensis TaxID=1723361 RepID=UPI003D7FD80E
MLRILRGKLEFIFNMYNDLLTCLEEENYEYKLKGLRSNTMGQQLHCVGGARESYYKSILEDEGFRWTCSLDGEKANDKGEVEAYLREYEKNIIDFMNSSEKLSDNQASLILDLLSHEYLHQGQLIRYLYANHLMIPNTWKEFWHLED